MFYIQAIQGSQGNRFIPNNDSCVLVMSWIPINSLYGVDIENDADCELCNSSSNTEAAEESLKLCHSLGFICVRVCDCVCVSVCMFVFLCVCVCIYVYKQSSFHQSTSHQDDGYSGPLSHPTYMHKGTQ